MYVNQIYDPNHVISNWFPYKSARLGKQLRKTSDSISSDYVTVTNVFAVEFEVLRSSVVPGDPETYSVTLLIQHYWRKQAACCASTSSAAHCHVDLSWYKWHEDPQVSRQGLAVLFRFVVRPWRSERVEAVGFQSFLYEQRYRICFQSHQNTRAAQKLKLNGKCIRHSDVFVWNGVWVFAQLFS